MFGEVESLHRFHKNNFLPALEKAARPLLSPEGQAADTESDGKLSSDVAMAVGRTFSGHVAFMKMYSTYVKSVASNIYLCFFPLYLCDFLNSNLDNASQRVRTWRSDRVTTPVSQASSKPVTPSSSSAQLATMGAAMSIVGSPALASDSVSSKFPTLTSGQRKRIRAYLKRCGGHPRHSQLNLECYLHLPVQRITRYPLLVRSIASVRKA